MYSPAGLIVQQAANCLVSGLDHTDDRHTEVDSLHVVHSEPEESHEGRQHSL